MTTLVTVTLRTSLILTIGIIAAVALRRRSAAVRHWMLAMSIVCAGAAPILALVVPVWTVPGLSPSTASNTHVVVSVQSSVPGETFARSGSPRPQRARALLQLLESLIVPVWTTGALLRLTVLIIGLWRLSRLRAMSAPLRSQPFVELLQRLSAVFDIRRPVAMMRSDRPALVVAYGVRSPTVFLPPEAERWPRQRSEVVLAHEIAHVVRSDWVVQIVAEACKAMYWFNPLFWIACARLRHESECACDDAVVSLGIDSRLYAAELLEIARSSERHRQQWLPAPAMAAHASKLERRVRAMLNSGIDRNPITRQGRWIAALALLVVTLPIVSFAQTDFVSFSGVIVDEQDRVVPSATVTVSDAVRNVKHETQTDASGGFEFIGLPAGDYTYTAKQPGFRDLAGSLVLGGQSVDRTLKMQVSSLQETIHVVSNDGAITRARQTGSAVAKRPIDGCTTPGTGGHIRPPHKVKDVAPGYPGVNGHVDLAATIGTDGTVIDVQVVQADRPELVPAAIDAVRQWEFDATLLNCVPIEVQMNVSVTFGTH